MSSMLCNKPEQAIDEKLTEYALFALSTLVIIFSFDIIKNGIKNLIHKTPNMDTLVTLGVLTSYVSSIFMITKNFETACMILFFVKIGKYIEHKNIYKTKEALQKLVTITPKDATVFKDGEEIKVTIDEIQKEDIVICKPGEKIAVDGEVVERRNTY